MVRILQLLSVLHIGFKSCPAVVDDFHRRPFQVNYRQQYNLERELFGPRAQARAASCVVHAVKGKLTEARP